MSVWVSGCLGPAESHPDDRHLRAEWHASPTLYPIFTELASAAMILSRNSCSCQGLDQALPMREPLPIKDLPAQCLSYGLMFSGFKLLFLVLFSHPWYLYLH